MPNPLSIYIYIKYCHPLTVCFVVSQLFSVVRDIGCLKLGSKPAQLYVRLSIRPLGQQVYHVGKGIIRYYIATAAAVFVCLHFIPYRIPECSICSKSFALCERQPKIPLPVCSTLMGERIYCHPQTDCFVVSQLFSVARHIGCLKLGSKAAQLFGLIGFYSISTLVGYLMPNPLFIYILGIWVVNTFFRYTQLNDQTILF